jgi:hypothetical protein
MSVMSEVFTTLQAMSLLQLFLAFVACIGYTVAHGNLVESLRARGLAAGTAFMGAVGYATLCTQWVHAAMLVAFAMAGLGLFIGAVWLVSGVLGFSGARQDRSRDAAFVENGLHPLPKRLKGNVEHAHSH